MRIAHTTPVTPDVVMVKRLVVVNTKVWALESTDVDRVVGSKVLLGKPLVIVVLGNKADVDKREDDRTLGVAMLDVGIDTMDVNETRLEDRRAELINDEVDSERTVAGMLDVGTDTTDVNETRLEVGMTELISDEVGSETTEGRRPPAADELEPKPAELSELSNDDVGKDRVVGRVLEPTRELTLKVLELRVLELRVLELKVLRLVVRELVEVELLELELVELELEEGTLVEAELKVVDETTLEMGVKVVPATRPGTFGT